MIYVIDGLKIGFIVILDHENGRLHIVQLNTMNIIRDVVDKYISRNGGIFERMKK